MADLGEMRLSVNFESEETVWGRVRRSDERIQYSGLLKVVKSRVHLTLKFVPPHPFIGDMPERWTVKAASITEVYAKLVRFLDKHGVDLDC